MKAIALILGITVLAGCGESNTDRQANKIRQQIAQIQHQQQVADAKFRKDLLAACSARSK